MPATLTYPGVYIVELQNPMHNITGVATSITAFVGYTATGIDHRAQAIYSFGDFTRLFGGLAIDSELSYAVYQFFLNGGTTAYVVRVPHHLATAASVEVTGDESIDLTFTALSRGVEANKQITVDIDYDGVDFLQPGVDGSTFNVTVTNLAGNVVESFPLVSLNGTRQNYVVNVLNDFDTGSQLVSVTDTVGDPTNPLRTHVPQVSGVLGKRIQQKSGELLFFDPNSVLKFDKDYKLTLKISNPDKTFPEINDVTVLAVDVPVPMSAAAIASQVQSALANAVASNWKGATLRVIATKSDQDVVLRAIVNVPNVPDAQLAFSGTAAAPLGLDVTPTNVAHYALGTGRGGIGGQKASEPANDKNKQLPFSADLVGDPALFSGIYALEKVDLFNLLAIPDAARALAGSPAKPDPNVSGADVYPPAIAFCQKRRAFLLVDPPPNVNTVSAALDWKTGMAITPAENGACFFPRLRMPDPVNNYQLRTFPPSGVVAGLFARIDGSRGVWKAPAGTEASLTGVQALAYSLTDTENGILNPLGVNCIRNFPIYGPVLWGSRTLAGADVAASQWKYVPVRRLALFLEESLYRGSKWAVFEPNDEPLWASLRLSIGAFMNSLFRKGAFQGQSPNAAYFVKCDNETTTQNDIDSGVVNVLVGFAPLIPAEFVVIQIQQMAGQVQT
jgi:phage tail sheath protein FI